jgi:hypothetical protein
MSNESPSEPPAAKATIPAHGALHATIRSASNRARGFLAKFFVLFFINTFLLFF